MDGLNPFVGKVGMPEEELAPARTRILCDRVQTRIGGIGDSRLSDFPC